MKDAFGSKLKNNHTRKKGPKMRFYSPKVTDDDHQRNDFQSKKLKQKNSLKHFQQYICFIQNKLSFQRREALDSELDKCTHMRVRPLSDIDVEKRFQELLLNERFQQRIDDDVSKFIVIQA